MRTKLFQSIPALLAMLVVCTTSIAAAQTDAGEPARTPVMTYSIIGPDVDAGLGKPVEDVATSLGARQGWDVRADLERPSDANEAPAGQSHWLHHSTIVVGPQIDMVVLELRNPGLRVASAQHRPAAVVPPQARRDRILPGPTQLVANAAKELAADVGNDESENETGQAKPISIEVTGWSGPAAGIASLGDNAQPMAAEPATRSLQESVRMLAIAAASQAGAQPTLAETSEGGRLTIGVAKLPQAYAFTLTYRDGENSFTRTSPSTTRSQLFPMLKAMIRHALDWRDNVNDVVALEGEPAAVLGIDHQQLILHRGGNAVGIAPSSQKVVFKTRDTRDPAVFRMLHYKNERVLVQLASNTLTLIDTKTGAPSNVPAIPRSVGDLAYAGGNRFVALPIDPGVHSAVGREASWTAAIDEPAIAGPAIDQSLACVITKRKLLAFDLTSGTPRWQYDLPAEGVGPVAIVGSHIIVGCRNGLAAVVDTSGKAVSTWQGGDVMLASPVAIDDAGSRALIATKDNTLSIVNLAAGKTVSQYRAPNWLTHVATSNENGKLIIASADLAGVVRFHSAADLAPVREINLHAKPAGDLIFGTLPERWYTDQLPSEARCLIALDEQGLMYLIALPE